MLEGARVHTTLPAMDIERAKAFYTKKVGATAGDSSPGGMFFMFGESRFVIYPTPNPNRGGHTQMGISVKDVGAAVRELRGRGVTFEDYDMPGLKTVDGIATTPGGMAAWFKDTEGNTIGLIQLGP
jgi:predicted enzyme related to lactoylglutathione lyase